MSQHSKEYRDKVEELKAKIFVTIKKFMSRHFSGATDKLVATKFYVATQDTHVTTITRQLQQNYVATLSNYVTTESKKKAQNYVVIETTSHDKSSRTKMTTVSRQSNQLGHNF